MPQLSSPRTVLAGAFSIGLAVVSYFAKLNQEAIDPSDYLARAENILRTTPLIDGHNDLPYLLRIELQNKIYNNSFTFRDSNYNLNDLLNLFLGSTANHP